MRSIAALSAGVLLPQPASCQQAGNVVLESSEQLFCVLAALNAAGYDAGLGAAADSTRLDARAFLASKHAPVAEDLGKFYASHRAEGDSGADLGQYVSLALLLGPPPEFHPTVQAQDLPPDAKGVRGLVPLLKSFYQQANLASLWEQLQPRYQAEVERYTEAVRKSIALSDAYLRFPSGAYLGRTYTIYLSLLAAPEQVHARIYGANYYLVVAPSKEAKLKEIRHQYLHFLLDPLAVKYAAEIDRKADLQAIARQAEGLEADFREDFPLLVTECLIRAAELRMDKRPKVELEKSAQELTASGLILVPYFNEALAEFEQQEAAMNVWYRSMVLGIDLRAERKRLAAVQFVSRRPSAATETAPALSEEERLLNRGDNLIAEGRYGDAKTLFQSVLTKSPKSERALFGMAVVASNSRKPGLAEEYFLKTLDTARDLRIVTWSHIYLGRLYDLEGKRSEAIAHYRAASLTTAAVPSAARAVQSGLDHPFGSKP